MALPQGARVGPYEVIAPLGAGGMGEVYRARDTRLKRDVALKVLPPFFADDPERLARFQREAEVLASLNHPNIAHLYGIEEAAAAPGTDVPTVAALVMELVEGDTLGDRLERGALPLEEALPLARQIAAALEAAHDMGVVHRDLKPANVKVSPNGTVKVLDFGLAKALEPAGGAPPSGALLTVSPTMVSPAQVTSAGVILGTAAYMSPEQARGRAVDRRADVWAFGCLLYEMLAGRRVFAIGETVSDAVAAVLREEPDWSALPPATPLPVRRLLRRCLEKDASRRLHHMADARLELDDAIDGRGESGLVALPARASAWAPALAAWLVAGLLAGGLAAGTAVWALRAGTASGTGEATATRRLELNLPLDVELFTASTRTVAVSPDGSRLAFVGTLGGSRQVYVRRLDQYEATPLRGSDGATACFFSPDGQSIGIVTAAGVLKTISLADGLVTTYTGDASFLYGAAWAPDDQIVFIRGGTLWRVPRTGGAQQRLTTLDGEQGDTLHAWPVVLPHGRAMLFGAASGDRWRIDALIFATGERRTVMDSGTLPLYAATGHLVFFRDGELLAAPFDADGLRVTGPAVQAIGSLPSGGTDVPVVDMSASGTVVYAPTTAVSRLVWVSREGVEQPLNETLRSYASPRLSPDGTRVVVQAGDLWVQDLARATFSLLATRDAVTNGFPVWTDGRHVMFRTPRGLRVQNVEESGEGQVIAGTSEFDYPGSLSADGETLVFLRSSQVTSFDIYTLPVRDPSGARPVLKTDAYEGGARLSPDGRWLVYVSNESGRNEVYVRPFPGPGRRWQVSAGGGTQPTWNPNGREIFYRDGDDMIAVEVSTAPDVRLSPPRVLFRQRYAFGAGITIPNYDVSRDGQRFIMVKDASTAGRLHVVLHGLSELTRRAPAPDTPAR